MGPDLIPLVFQSGPFVMPVEEHHIPSMVCAEHFRQREVKGPTTTSPFHAETSACAHWATSGLPSKPV